MQEKTIENKLKKAVVSRGGLCVKFVSPSFAGVPDRIVLLPGGQLAFVETKATGEKMRPLQKRIKRQPEALGFKVYCLDNTEMIGELLNEIQST